MAISRNLARLMGGDITITSEVGVGSEFRVSFFAQKEVPLTNETIASGLPLQQVPEKTLYGTKVLVAEDDEIGQFLIKKMLAKIGIECDIAINGQDAIRCCDSVKYDMVFMDCQMPEANGFEALEQIRKSNSTIPVIALTAHALNGDKERFLK